MLAGQVPSTPDFARAACDEPWARVLAACADLGRLRIAPNGVARVHAAHLADAGCRPLRDCLVVFEILAAKVRMSVAREAARGRAVETGLAEAVRQIGEILDTPMKPFPRAGDAREAGRSLGMALGAWRAAGGGMSDAAVIAGAAFHPFGCGAGEGVRMLDTFDEALRIPQAGLPAAAGLLGCLDTWCDRHSMQAMSGRALAWLMAGMRLRLDEDMLISVACNGAWNDARYEAFLGGVAGVAARWSETEYKAFMQELGKATLEVNNFNPCCDPSAWERPEYLRTAAKDTIDAVERARRVSGVERRLAAATGTAARRRP